jgi:hypothetical protein
MFARLPRAITISEAQPIAAVCDDPRLGPGERQRALAALIRLYSRKVQGLETCSLFKFGVRELLAWRVLAEAFPDVPRVVLHRDPVEVLVSNLASPAEASMPGYIPAAALGTPPFPVSSHEDFTLFVFARVFARAAEFAATPGTLTISYPSLPDAVESLIAPHFGLTLSDGDRDAMRTATGLYAKDAARSAAFVPDSAAKQAQASGTLRERAERWLGESWRALEGV